MRYRLVLAVLLAGCAAAPPAVPDDAPVKLVVEILGME